jgi:hypothetical protein
VIQTLKPATPYQLSLSKFERFQPQLAKRLAPQISVCPCLFTLVHGPKTPRVEANCRSRICMKVSNHLTKLPCIRSACSARSCPSKAPPPSRDIEQKVSRRPGPWRESTRYNTLKPPQSHSTCSHSAIQSADLRKYPSKSGPFKSAEMVHPASMDEDRGLMSPAFQPWAVFPNGARAHSESENRQNGNLKQPTKACIASRYVGSAVSTAHHAATMGGAAF